METKPDINTKTEELNLRFKNKIKLIKTASFILAVFILFPLTGFTQNLVLNPGFEDYKTCPTVATDKAENFSLYGWKSPTGGTPDFFHECSEFNGVPTNWAGKRTAKDGKAYVGIIMRRNFGLDTDDKRMTYNREYIQGKLITPLERGKKYKASFYIALASSSTYASNEVGLHFSFNAITQGGRGILPYEPHFTNTPKNIMFRLEWTKVEGTFTAVGGEEYITIGNFSYNYLAPYAQLYQKVGTETLYDMDYSYYYIDQVSVEKIESEEEPAPKEKLTAYNDILKKLKTQYKEEEETPKTEKLLASTDKVVDVEVKKEEVVTRTFEEEPIRKEPELQTIIDTGPKIVRSENFYFDCGCEECKPVLERTDYEEVYPDIPLDFVRKNQKIILDEVRFIKGTDKLLKESGGQLDDLVNILINFPEIELKLIIHMDSGITDDENQSKDLSKDTAAALYRYLRQRGANNKINYNGFGMRNFSKEKSKTKDRDIELIIENM